MRGRAPVLPGLVAVAVATAQEGRPPLAISEFDALRMERVEEGATRTRFRARPLPPELAGRIHELRRVAPRARDGALAEQDLRRGAPPHRAAVTR